MNIEMLRSVSFLKELTDDELQIFTALLSIRSTRPREQIIKEGEEITAFHIVCEGTVHVRRLAQKREVLLGRVGAGGFFGEINLFDPGVATASIYAMDVVTLAIVDYENFRNFISLNPAIGCKIVSGLMAEMSRRLRQTNDRLINSEYWAGAR